MPRMDGFTLLNAIRKNENVNVKNLPVLLFSSLMSEDVMSRAGLMKVDGHVLKPDIYKLVERVSEIYEKSGSPE
jgi:two-component system chemotaxis response regulator CheV